MREGAYAAAVDGVGDGTEGSRALPATALTELGVRTGRAETMVVNGGSRDVMEKLGTTFTDAAPTPSGTERVEGSEHEGVRYEITKEQWLRGR